MCVQRVERTEIMSTRVIGKHEFWPRKNEHSGTDRVQSIEHFRSLLGQMQSMFIPGLHLTEMAVKLNVIELEGQTFMFTLKLPSVLKPKVVTLPYQVFEDYGVYDSVKKVMELMRVTDSPAPWFLDKRIDSGGLQWEVNRKEWNYRARNEDFMEKTYGFATGNST